MAQIRHNKSVDIVSARLVMLSSNRWRCVCIVFSVLYLKRIFVVVVDRKNVTSRNFDLPYLDLNPCGGAVCTTCHTTGYTTAFNSAYLCASNRISTPHNHVRRTFHNGETFWGKSTMGWILGNTWKRINAQIAACTNCIVFPFLKGCDVCKHARHWER